MTKDDERARALADMPDLFGDIEQKPQPKLCRWYDHYYIAIRAALQPAAKVDLETKQLCFDEAVNGSDGDMWVIGRVFDWLEARGYLQGGAPVEPNIPNAVFSGYYRCALDAPTPNGGISGEAE